MLTFLIQSHITLQDYRSNMSCSIRYTFDMSCCPQGSWPQLQSEYKPQGEQLSVHGVPLYHVGKGKHALLIVSDIFGATSGRHRNVADLFASLDYDVYLPEILVNPYTGTGDIMENIKGQDQAIMAQKFQKVNAYLQSRGIKQYFVIGFCWGVWWAFKMSPKYESFIAIAGPHPSLRLEGFFGGSETKLANEIRCPAFFLPAQNDPPNVKAGGELVKMLGERFGENKIGTVQFPQMAHGWVVRGDMANQKVSRDVVKAITLIDEYFKKFQ